MDSQQFEDLLYDARELSETISSSCADLVQRWRNGLDKGPALNIVDRNCDNLERLEKLLCRISENYLRRA